MKKILIKIISIFVLILLVMLVIHISNDINEEDNFDNNENILVENKSNFNENENKTQAVEELSTDDEMVQKLYNYIRDINYYEEKIMYQDRKILLDDLSNQLKLLTIFDNLDKSESEQEEAFIDEAEQEHVFFSEEVVLEKARKIFGNDVEIVNEDVLPWPGSNIIYKNGRYECFESDGGGGIPWESSFAVIEKAEKDNNHIYIYDKYVHLVERDDIKDEDGNVIAGYYDIYADSGREKLLAEKVNFSENGLFENLDNKEKQMEDINNYLENKLTTYKHTFNKSDDGSFYWYSTEPIN